MKHFLSGNMHSSFQLSGKYNLQAFKKLLLICGTLSQEFTFQKEITLLDRQTAVQLEILKVPKIEKGAVVK